MFYSILFPAKEQQDKQTAREMPAFFRDLNIDQIAEAVLEPKERFELNNIFYSPLADKEVIIYRQEVLRDLEDKELREALEHCSEAIHGVYRCLFNVRRGLTSSEPSENNYLTRGKLLENAERYCQETSLLLERLSSLTLSSAGLISFCEYLREYCASPAFSDLSLDIKKLREAFSAVTYCMVLHKNVIHIRENENLTGFVEPITKCFEKFRTGDSKDYRQKISDEPLASNIEAATLELLSKQNKPLFAELEEFSKKHFRFEDKIISLFSREIQFYLSWLDFTDPVKEAGLPFCYPALSDTISSVQCTDGFDLALAHLIKSDTVTNSFALKAPEQIVVITGPNQGGKTTFARAFGQLHYFASLGLHVPGRSATAFLFDNIFTHFGQGEDLSALEGKLRDDLIRLHAILDEATSRSLVIINEIFTSTVVNDALILGNFLIKTLVSIGAPAVVITFLDELAVFGPETVSMMSAVLEDDPAARTYKITRKPPDGLAYAIHIAGKYGLTYEQLSGRLRR